MKFSVVIPALNEEKYIGILLMCLTNQTLKDFEVIVVDGGSKDKTKEVVSSFSDRLRINIVDSPNGNVSKSRNKGALASYFDHLIFFDADILIEDDFIEKLSNSLSKKDSDFLNCWYAPLSNRLDDRFYGSFLNIYSEVLKSFAPVVMGVFMCVHKDAFNKVGGFDESMHFLEDVDLYRRLHKAGFTYKLLRDPKIIYSVRRSDSESRFVTVMKAVGGNIMLAFGMKRVLQKLVSHEVLN
ncbi:glycosyltransferase [Patescibacteria group bacterium]|nr:glycosyltransferase [Patescibacteria group bacterium]